jgi:type IV pilus assembly protein PilY1
MIANPNPCESGGASWLMELDMYSGARLPSTPFDLNGDGVFDEQDYIEIATGEVNEAGEPITIKVPASGKKSRVGIIKTPSIVKGDAGREYKYTSGSSGEMERVVESRGYRVGRQSWRQLQ